MKYNRKKNFFFLLSLIYKISKILPLKSFNKFKIFSRLEWIFWRLSIEQISSFNKKWQVDYHVGTINFINDNFKNNPRILDLGCASGQRSFLLSKIAKEVIAIDYDLKLIKEAQKEYANIKNLSFICLDLKDYLKDSNIKTNKFDLVFCSHILEHVENFEEILIDLKKITKNIYIEVPDFECNILNKVKKEYNIEPSYTDDDHVFEFERNDLKEIFIKNNLKIVNEDYNHAVMRFILEV
jgi:SAM-dependent methyltransferase